MKIFYGITVGGEPIARVNLKTKISTYLCLNTEFDARIVADRIANLFPNEQIGLCNIFEDGRVIEIEKVAKSQDYFAKEFGYKEKSEIEKEADRIFNNKHIEPLHFKNDEKNK